MQRLRNRAVALTLLCVLGSCVPAARPDPSGAPPATATGGVPHATAGATATAPGTTGQLPGASLGRLEVVGRMAMRRAVHTATALADGRILLAGGCTLDSCEGVTATTELLDPVTGTVEAGPDMLQARVGHGAVALPDGRVLVIGGFGSSGVVATTELFDPATTTFVAGPSLPAPWADPFVAVLVDGSVLVAGGYDGTASMTTSVRLDQGVAAVVPAGSLNASRSGHAGTLLPDGRVLLVGGRDIATDTVLASAEVYDPATNTWTPTADIGIRRHKLAVVALQDGRALVIGGSDERDGGGRYRSAELFDPATSTVQPTGEMAAPRYKLAGSVVVLRDGRVLVAAGAPSAELFDPATGRFDSVAAVDGASADYSFSAAVALPDGSAIVSGGYDLSINLTNQVLGFSP